MNNDLIVGNILVWSLQVCAVLLVGGIAPRLFRMNPPSLRLMWLQMVLALALLLPVTTPWHRDIVAVGSEVTRVSASPRSQPGLPAMRWTPRARSSRSWLSASLYGWSGSLQVSPGFVGTAESR
ncbi:MAG: hypothetical protein JWN34_4233 [Bryobacterales bacterium]|nr:hypothetical protein [Bryobacterales bacterium]